MAIRLNLDLDKYKGLTDNIVDKVVSDLSLRFAKEEDLYLEYMFRCCVKPKIKGEITPGKIKWRGLTLSKKIDPEFPNDGGPGVIVMSLQLFQRGEPVPFNPIEFNAWKSWKKGLDAMREDRSKRLEYLQGEEFVEKGIMNQVRIKYGSGRNK